MIKRNQSGFILLEFILAMALFSLGILTISSVLFQQLKISKHIYYNGVVLKTLEQHLDEIRFMPSEAALALGTRELPNPKEVSLPDGTFVRTIAVYPHDPELFYVTIDWVSSRPEVYPSQRIDGIVWQGDL